MSLDEDRSANRQVTPAPSTPFRTISMGSAQLLRRPCVSVNENASATILQLFFLASDPHGVISMLPQTQRFAQHAARHALTAHLWRPTAASAGIRSRFERTDS